MEIREVELERGVVTPSNRQGRNVYGQPTTRIPNQPLPPVALPDQIWERIFSLVDSEPAPEPSIDTQKELPKRRRGAARKRSRRRRLRRTLDAAGFVFWLLVLARITTGSLDRDIIHRLAPSAAWVTDAPWIVLLFLFAALLLMVRLTTLSISLAYVAAFPAVVLFWKVPRLLAKHRKTVPLIALISFALSVLGRAKHFVLAFACATLAALLVLIGSNVWTVGIGMVIMLMTLLWSLAKSVVDFLKPAPFLRAQEQSIRWLLRTRFIRQFTSPLKPNQLQLKQWKLEDAKKYRDSAGYNLLVDQGLRWWQKLIVESKNGPGVTLSSALLFVIMVAEVVAAFAFINYGAFKLRPDQFGFTVHPDGYTLTYYAVVAAYFGEISGLVPTGPLAIAVKLANGIVGSLGVLTIIGSLILAYRAARADASATQAIASLEQERQDLRDLARDNFALDYQDIEQRLDRASWEMLGAFHWLAGKNTSSNAGGRPL